MKLQLNVAEARLIAHALNCGRIKNFSDKQLEALPALGKKIATYLVENDNGKSEVKQVQSKPKQCFPFRDNPELGNISAELRSIGEQSRLKSD